MDQLLTKAFDEVNAKLDRLLVNHQDALDGQAALDEANNRIYELEKRLAAEQERHAADQSIATNIIRKERERLAYHDAYWMEGLGLGMMSYRDPAQAREDIERPLREQLAEVVGALHIFGGHLAECAPDEIAACTCGYGKALAKGRGA
jgi:hypothetical protein